MSSWTNFTVLGLSTRQLFWFSICNFTRASRAPGNVQNTRHEHAKPFTH